MDTVFDAGHRRRAPVPHRRRRPCLRAGRHRHEVRPARRALRARGARRRPRAGCRSSGSRSSPTPTRRSARRRSTPHIREARRRRRRLPRARVRPGERRHRLVAEGHPRRPDHDPRAGPPTPASSPRRAAARSSPRPTSSSDLHALNGRWHGRHGQRRRHRRRHAAERRAPSDAQLEVDVRAVRARRGLEAAEAEIRSRSPRRPSVPDTTAEFGEMARWWPMEKLERSGRLVEHAIALAGRLGFELRDTATGGASDANTTAGMGVPSLDGLGPIGGNDHSPDEYLEVDSIVPRTTLARRAAAGDRARSGGPRLAGRAAGVTERRPDLVAAGRGRHRVGYSPGDRRRRRGAGSPARRTRARTAPRCIPATRRPGAGRVGDRRAARSARPGSRSADVVRTRMYVVRLGGRAGGRGRPRRAVRRRSGRPRRWSQVAGLIEPRCSSRSRPRPAGAPEPGRARRQRRAARATTAIRPRPTTSPRNRFSPPRDDRAGRRPPRPLDADVERRRLVVVDDDHHVDRGRAPRAPPARRAAGSRAPARQPSIPGARSRRARDG